MKRIKIFLAFSNELDEEKEAIELMVSHLNSNWIDRDIFFDLVFWQSLSLSIHSGEERIQDYFIKEMLKCDMVIVLFYKKAGRFTVEEYRVAYKNLKKGNKPYHLFIYFKSDIMTLNIETFNFEEYKKVHELKNEIEESQHIYTIFTSKEDLCLKIQQQIELSLINLKSIGQEHQVSIKKKIELGVKKYKKHLIRNFLHLDFTGLNTTFLKPLELESIYIMRQIATSQISNHPLKINDAEQLKASTFEKEKVDKNVEFQKVFKKYYQGNSRSKSEMRILILGEPGSGKTTLLKMLTLKCFQGKKDNFFSRFIPVFISLKEFGLDPEGSFQGQNISQLTKMSLEKQNLLDHSFLDYYFENNQLLFLFDGLDEIVDKDIRRDVIAWLQEQYIGLNPLIITSRFSGLIREEALTFRESIPVFEIQNFTMNDIELFLNKWYQLTNISNGINEYPENFNGIVKKRAKELSDIIKREENKSLMELATNPLLLTILATIHHQRAELPKEKHNLYKACLEIMINQWILSKRIGKIGFSYNDCINYLSRIALYFMKFGIREINIGEIKKCCFPSSINEELRDLFLKEMVEKSGLLYKLGENLGFRHLTFQEYLTASYFAKIENQNEILIYYNNQNWEDTFKIFVNIGDAEKLFNEVINNLLDKQYWKYMNFWENCIKEINKVEKREKIEVEFSKKVTEILLKLEHDIQTEQIINELFVHYPLYKHSKELKTEAWKLLNDSIHPFAKSIGISILYRADKDTKKEMITKVKEIIKYYEQLDENNEQSGINTLFQLSNCFMILIASGNIIDFDLIISLLVSKNGFLQFLSLFYLRYLISFKELRDIRGIRDFIDIWDLKYFRNPQGIAYMQNMWYLRSLKGDLRYNRGFWYLVALIDMLERGEIFDVQVLSLINIKDILYIQGSQITQYFESIFKSYLESYKEVIKANQDKINIWGEKAKEKLHNLSDEEVLKYFPYTDMVEELKGFRNS